MENENKHLDKILKGAFQEKGIEKPSASFLDAVMAEVAHVKIKKTKPIIAPVWWVCSAAIMLVLMSASFFIEGEGISLDTSFFQKVSLPELSTMNFFDNLPISKGITIGILLAALMLFTQFFLLKNHISKRFEHS